MTKNRHMNEYIEKLNNKNELNHDFFENLREFASQNHVPIIKRDSLLVIQALIKIHCVKKILEVGTAIGYSALSFTNVDSNIMVDTIERNQEMFEIATDNVKKLNKEQQIRIFNEDALDIDNNKLGTYDLIFIDAAKAQYEKFFNKFAPLLSKTGLIISDNILFHGCVENHENLSKNVLHLVKKIEMYNDFLNTQTDYTTFYLDSGDGLAITMRKNYENND